MDPFSVFEQMFDKVWLAMQEYLLNYTFGIVAIIFGVRTISVLVSKGKFSIVSALITLICGTMAVSMNQDIWVDFIDLIKSQF